MFPSSQIIGGLPPAPPPSSYAFDLYKNTSRYRPKRIYLFVMNIKYKDHKISNSLQRFKYKICNDEGRILFPSGDSQHLLHH